MIIDEENYLAHYGIVRRSGRYPWGSGADTAARSRAFLSYVKELKDAGMSEADIARGLSTDDYPFTSTDIRALRTVARNAAKQADIAQAQRLKDKGNSNVEIAKVMGTNEANVRNLLKPGAEDRSSNMATISNMLKDEVDSKGFIDVGAGVENQLGISKEKLTVATKMLREQGYSVHSYEIEQVGTGLPTKMRVLCPPGTTQKDAWMNRNNVQQIQQWSEDNGRSTLGIVEPLSINSKRVGIRYAEDGGTDADGVIYVRPGVKDISLDGSQYAQVRIAVDGKRYLKGMAMYKDDLPDGVDLLFNTNKSKNIPKMEVLKEMKTKEDGSLDTENPFGASLKRQIVKVDKDGKEVATSAMNIVNETGDWDKWSKNLSSQMLSKQSPKLAKTQLDLTHANKLAEFEEIMSLTNPAIKKKMLQSFSDDVDSAAVHLKAAQMKGQSTHVILPINSLKDTEVYAPNFKNGERVALIRYPHGGTFEIPELTVNNNHPASKKALGNAKDAIGINSKVAERLSGADFDGDTVLVIPNRNKSIKTTPALESLKNFDHQREYAPYDGMRTIDGGIYNAKTRKASYPPGGKLKGNKQMAMGDISNLITDMTIKGANESEIARAVRHSMVVIDSEKHMLDFKRSAETNAIKALKEKYQRLPDGSAGGASTLISRAKSEERIPHRMPRRARDGGPINPKTGERMYTETGKTYIDKKGNTVSKKSSVEKLAYAKNAFDLSSGTTMESVYAQHSNNLKALANRARKALVETSDAKYSPTAKKAYSKEVASLNHKLNVALKNAPRERQAQILANAIVTAKRKDYPDMDKADLKKIKFQALAEARVRTGAAKDRVEFTKEEWDAVQAGAISTHKLNSILANADLDKVKELAMPRQNPVMTDVKQRRAAAMLSSGYTQAEVAEAIGVPLSTLKSSL